MKDDYGKKSGTKVVPTSYPVATANKIKVQKPESEMTYAERKAELEEELNDDSYEDMGRGAEGKWMI